MLPWLQAEETNFIHNGLRNPKSPTGRNHLSHSVWKWIISRGSGIIAYSLKISCFLKNTCSFRF